MTTILAPVDFSPVTAQIVAEAGELARAFRARVLLLAVMVEPIFVKEYAPPPDRLERVTTGNEPAARRRLAALVKRLGRQNVAATSEVLQGSPVRVILEQARKAGVSYIVMGSHGHTALYELIAGSTTQGVLKAARCPVLIISPPAARTRPARKLIPVPETAPMSTTHTTRISLKLRELSQLFNSMDPSPFIDRDLDHDAEEFIVSSARDAHGSRAFELVIHLESPADALGAPETEEAVRHYFSVRAELKRREFRRLLRRGHTVLAIGLLFLATCLFLSGLVAKLTPAALAKILHEGLVIVGWVAMWKPLEIYLYDWWPLRKEWLDLQRLAKMRVRLVMPPGKPERAERPAATAPSVPAAVPPAAECATNGASQPNYTERKTSFDVTLRP